VKSSGEKTRPGVVSVDQKTAALKIVFLCRNHNSTLSYDSHQRHRATETKRKRDGRKERKSDALCMRSLPSLPLSSSVVSVAKGYLIRFSKMPAAPIPPPTHIVTIP